ncbi:Indoleamine 2-3-dioxygenase [Penicillium canariense]|uniref:Indoleamine 2,3-dioxygenase n=1 Tax=Penicillium canariense TaxID=189055 RepID=A0A9W9HSE5_9EURO|nr:Indoleamine 2-3-dioxygenase [Penicillium canariense]KAJ5153511.1 Indoleamine 2-3-dioxygenase [Penicillium canariense]
MLPPVPSPAAYGISPDQGFLPPEPPLETLPDLFYAKWEEIAANLQPLLLSRRIRAVVDRMPLLSTVHLHTDAEWRRAYVVLVFILHGYVWGGDRPAERIPPQLTVPLFEVCERLEVPPVATYAGVCLWNYKPIFPDEPADDLNNLACLQTFTGSLDEQWFYLVSVAIEARGGPSIPLMLEAIAAARVGKTRVVTECLQQLAEILDEITALLQRMYDNCDPYVFYNRIRPYLAGSKNMADAGLPMGLLYDDGRNPPEYRQYGGGSNAQSSLIQFFDIVLGVEHRPTGVTRKDQKTAAASREDGPKSRHGFIHEMRGYMPGPHRRFLEDVDSIANIRPFVDAHRTDPALKLAYDACLSMLRTMRDKHIQIVSRYIIVQSRVARRASQSAGSDQQPPTVNLATAVPADSKKLRGTGGTALIPFLKQARDETGEPAIDAWAKRLLSNGPARVGFASLSKVGEQPDGHLEVVGLCGTWTADDSEGGICHW